MTSDFREKARRLRNAVERVAAGVYFAPEALAAYAALGFDRSPAVDQTGVARPELKSYFVSRGACMGQVPGEIVAAAFGCFNPKVVEMAVTGGWPIASRDAVLDARERGSTEMLKRVLGDHPEGLERVTELLKQGAEGAPWAAHPIYSGLRSLGVPDDPISAMWRAADLLREHRGDSHVITWAVAGVDGMEILLLTEQWWGLPPRADAPTRGWQAADMDAGFQRLHRRGLMTDDEQLTAAGRAFREEIEVRTTSWSARSSRPSTTTLTLVEHLDVWSDAIIAAGSYPQRIAGVYNTGGGPHFGAGLSVDTAADLYGKEASLQLRDSRYRSQRGERR